MKNSNLVLEAFEISVLRAALNEALEFLDDPEFSIRMGCERREAEDLLKKLLAN